MTMPFDNTDITEYKVRWATREDFHKVVSIFRPRSEKGDKVRPKTVFERTPDAFSDAISGERILLMVDNKNDIKMIGAIHLLPGSIELGKSKDLTTFAKFNVAEIGSIYRPGEEPSGFCLELMYNLLILQTLKKAREASINLLITQVVANNDEGIRKLLTLQHGWEEFTINEIFQDQFKRTVADAESRETKLVSYNVRPSHAITAAADSILGYDRNKGTFMPVDNADGIIEAFDYSGQENGTEEKAGKIVRIDFRRTELFDVANAVSFHCHGSENKSVIEHADWSLLNKLLLGPQRGPNPANDRSHSIQQYLNHG